MRQYFIILIGILLLIPKLSSIVCKYGSLTSRAKKTYNLNCGEDVKYCIKLYGYLHDYRIISLKSFYWETFYYCDYKNECKENGIKRVKNERFTASKYCCNNDYCNFGYKNKYQRILILFFILIMYLYYV